MVEGLIGGMEKSYLDKGGGFRGRAGWRSWRMELYWIHGWIGGNGMGSLNFRDWFYDQIGGFLGSEGLRDTFKSLLNWDSVCIVYVRSHRNESDMVLKSKFIIVENKKHLNTIANQYNTIQYNTI